MIKTNLLHLSPIGTINKFQQNGNSGNQAAINPCRGAETLRIEA